MDRQVAFPRLVVAGLAGDAGKTLVSAGLSLRLRERGLPVGAFKKGPDYIDTAWLTWATGRPARNLDTHLMGDEVAHRCFVAHAVRDGINVIEGNRGLFDGGDARGTHSTARLAKLLHAPVVLVVDAAKTTRTAAACVLGCQTFDPEARFSAVVLNRVAGSRHERVLREAIETSCGLPVVGAIARDESRRLLVGRHLGLVTPHEYGDTVQLRSELREMVASLDIDRIVAIGRQAPALESVCGLDREPAAVPGPRVKVGYLLDSAFTFYYADNLEALESAGAVLVPIPALGSAALPADLHAMYIGGGFPETHAAALASNRSFLDSIARAAAQGLPIYAECGGLMLLSKAISWRGQNHPMAGVLPFGVEMQPKPQGHGYTRLLVDRPNPFFAEGTVLNGHEFHYSRVLSPPAGSLRESAGICGTTACSVQRGSGCGAGRDGVVINQTFASYTHLHALATPEWAPGVVRAARRFASRGSSEQR